jgi:hypothetical protein
VQVLAVSAAAAAAERPASHKEGTCTCRVCHSGRSTRGQLPGADLLALLSVLVHQSLLFYGGCLAAGWSLHEDGCCAKDY